MEMVCLSSKPLGAQLALLWKCRTFWIPFTASVRNWKIKSNENKENKGPVLKKQLLRTKIPDIIG
jgi:hypothetical protein